MNQSYHFYLVDENQCLTKDSYTFKYLIALLRGIWIVDIKCKFQTFDNVITFPKLTIETLEQGVKSALKIKILFVPVN